MGVCYDPALRCLTENPGQAHNRKAVRFNEVPQDISRPHAGKLVDITDQYESHSIRDRFQKIVEKQQVDHGALIHNEHIALERILLVFLVSFRRFRLQKAVDGLRLHSGRLGEPLCGAACRRCKQDLGTGSSKSGDNAQGRCCLAGARSACQDQHLALHSLQYRLHLHLVILHSCLYGNTGFQSIRPDRDPFPVAEYPAESAHTSCLRKEKGRQIDGRLCLCFLLPGRLSLCFRMIGRFSCSRMIGRFS